MENLISIEWLLEHLNDDDLIVLDASIKKAVSKEVDNELQGIRIINAVYFDLKNSFSDQDSSLPNMMPTQEVFNLECQKLGINKNSTIVVYDNLGIYSSPRVWWMFKAMGHKNVAVLNGGLPLWHKAGYPCEKISPQHPSLGNFEGSYNAEYFKDSKYVLENISNKNCMLIDARSEGRFNGTDPEPRQDLRSGHIPNSKNLPYSKLLNKDGRMKPISELQNLFDSLEVENKKLVFSCGSGLTACITLLASELINNNQKSVYDGSWTEWGQYDHLPIEK